MKQNGLAPPVPMSRRSTLGWATMLACCLATCARRPELNRPDPQPPPSLGQNVFISADGQNGDTSRPAPEPRSGGTPTTDLGPGEGTEPGRSVEEGDIYRVFSNTHHILNLNSYRGLQVIDFSNAADPKVIGALRVSGTPVEMYVVDQRAYLLLNHWEGYYARPETGAGTLPTRFEGGVVVSVDLVDPTRPRVIGRNRIPGSIRTSRLARGGGTESLYIAASDGTKNYVRSLRANPSGALTSSAELDLGGSITDIQATPDWLLVARHEAETDRGRSRVTVIDIRDPAGTMRPITTVTVQGVVQNKFNMDIRGNILRVVSANSWNAPDNTNHVETFNVMQEVLNPRPLDHKSFGKGENLYATLFLEDRAFFVTYRRVDPFHAFRVEADGTLTEMSEFIVSGWNDFFQPVSGQTRLIGIGQNDQNGRNMAVSLYDITDLLNPNPLLDRKEVDLAWSWSEANWDDRAFSVLENATSARSASGVTETGLVLLPFSGGDSRNDAYVSGVQVFTFSDRTLTLRGTMMHGSPVRRSFVADGPRATTANLSNVELSLFDVRDPDTPEELGRLELAPNYSTVLLYDTHAVRRNSERHFYAYWRRNDILADDTLEIVPLTEDIDRAKPVAKIAIPWTATIHQVGNRLAVVNQTETGAPPNNGPTTGNTRIDIYDLSDPTSPRHVGDLTTSDLPLTYDYGSFDRLGCSNCFDFPSFGQSVEVAGDALVFVARHGAQALQGVVRARFLYPNEQRYGERCWMDTGIPTPNACTYLTGGIRCTRLTPVDGDPEPEVCTGSIARCTQASSGETDCTEVEDLSTISLSENTYTYDQYRHWQHHDLHVVDLRDTPALGSVVRMDRSEEFTSRVTEGAAVHLSYKQPHRVPGDPRPFVRHFFRTIDLTDPTDARTGPSINIPGQLVAVDGHTVLTRDDLWGRTIVETSMNKLEVIGSEAFLRGIRMFPNRIVHDVRLDGANHVLVSYQEPWGASSDGTPETSISVDAVPSVEPGYHPPERSSTLAILGLTENDLPLLGSLEVHNWASLRGAIPGRALFTVPGGLLVINHDAPSQPFAQAYFPMNGWPQSIQPAGENVYLAAGRFGIYTFDLNTSNLLVPLSSYRGKLVPVTELDRKYTVFSRQERALTTGSHASRECD